MSNKNIFLTGFMGAGKSTVGRRLARQIGYRFADLDELVVAREGLPVARIFSVHGEAYFRDCEAAVLAEQATAEHVVFATGGGIVGRAANRALMKRHGCVVYLRADWPTLEQRLANSKGRPLIDPQEGWERAKTLWASRLTWYEEADLVVDTDQLQLDGVVRLIMRRLNLGEGQQ